MKRDVTAHLRSLLYDQGRVFLPGMGTFVAQSQEARRDPLGGTIYPPSKSIQFNANLFFDDGSLKSALSKDQEISSKAASRIVNEFVKDLKQKLSKGNDARIPGIGVLSYDRTQQLTFIPTKTNYSADSFGLPRVSAQLLVGRPNMAAINRPTIPITSQVPKASSKSWVVRNRAYLGGGIFAVAAIVFIVLVTRPDNSAPVILTNQSAQLNESTQQEVQEDIPLPPPPDVIERSEQSPDIAPPPTDPVPRGNAAPVVKKKTFVIVIGNFNDLLMVQKTMAQIRKLGLEPFAEPADGGTRVGIRSTYSDESEIDKVLILAQDEFDNEAYLLSK